MLDRLRRPLFIIAAIVWIIIIGVEIGSAWVPAVFDEAKMTSEASLQIQKTDLNSAERTQMLSNMVDAGRSSSKPPGLAIPGIALLDGLVFYSILLMGLALIIPERVQGRVQGIATLIVSIVVLIFGIVLAIKAFTQVMIMVGLFLAPPFGTLAYLAVWGFFNRGGALTILGLSTLIKLIFVLLLVLAQQRFLQNKGLVLLLATSLLANFIVAFLHGLVPIILVSITDGIGAIVVLILTAIWAIFLLIGSIISMVKAIV